MNNQIWVNDQARLHDCFTGAAVLALFLLCVKFCRVSKLQKIHMDLAPNSMFQDRAEPQSRMTSIRLRLDLLPIHLYHGKEKKLVPVLNKQFPTERKIKPYAVKWLKGPETKSLGYHFSSSQPQVIVRLAAWKQNKKGDDDHEQDTALQAVNPSESAVGDYFIGFYFIGWVCLFVFILGWLWVFCCCWGEGVFAFVFCLVVFLL